MLTSQKTSYMLALEGFFPQENTPIKKVQEMPSAYTSSFHEQKQRDRNYHLGGRSFYFFDFDDNIAYLSTPIIIFNKKTGAERFLSSGEWARHHHSIGRKGPFNRYYIDYNDETGSFRHFRDQKYSFIEKIVKRKQTFLSDIEKALQQGDYSWKAPSWRRFFYAVANQRPLCLITARGHERETIKRGIKLMLSKGHLPCPPNYLALYPVTHPEIRKTELQDPSFTQSIATLKQKAIRCSVQKAIEKYGANPYHRFGMSDDDPKNVELIIQEMKELKKDHPKMAFFVIQTFEDGPLKIKI